jgi:hypothetical protein
MSNTFSIIRTNSSIASEDEVRKNCHDENHQSTVVKEKLIIEPCGDFCRNLDPL